MASTREPRQFDPSIMDAAAETADGDLESLDRAAVKLLANWWLRHYMGAGHRRLARLLLKYAD